MKPYYQDKYATIYHGDCLDLLPDMPKVDLVLTDPQYGIGESNKKNLSRVRLALPKNYGDTFNDSQPTDSKRIELTISSGDWSIVWGGNYFNLPPSPCWLVWDKENGTNDFADCELAWTNFKKAVRLKRHMWNGMLRKNNEPRFHQTQKPVELMTWAIGQAPDTVQTILDPFMGSGTTLVAAKQLNRKAIGIEIEEKYCEIAAKRLSQEVLDFNG